MSLFSVRQRAKCDACEELKVSLHLTVVWKVAFWWRGDLDERFDSVDRFSAKRDI